MYLAHFYIIPLFDKLVSYASCLEGLFYKREGQLLLTHSPMFIFFSWSFDVFCPPIPDNREYNISTVKGCEVIVV